MSFARALALGLVSFTVVYGVFVSAACLATKGSMVVYFAWFACECCPWVTSAMVSTLYLLHGVLIMYVDVRGMFITSVLLNEQLFE